MAPLSLSKGQSVQGFEFNYLSDVQKEWFDAITPWDATDRSVCPPAQAAAPETVRVLRRYKTFVLHPGSAKLIPFM